MAVDGKYVMLGTVPRHDARRVRCYSPVPMGTKGTPASRWPCCSWLTARASMATAGVCGTSTVDIMAQRTTRRDDDPSVSCVWKGLLR
jgi:hypothetical protein